MQAYREAEECPRPPPPSFLLCEKAKPPEILINFMKILLSGKKKVSERKDITSSIAQDYICYSVSNGQWKIARHLGLGTAVQYLTREVGTKLVSMLNCFGLCTSHARVHKLEITVCHIILQSTRLLPETVSADNNKFRYSIIFSISRSDRKHYNRATRVHKAVQLEAPERLLFERFVHTCPHNMLVNCLQRF